MIENCGEGTVVHAGAFFGDFLPALSKHCKKVRAFEPNTLNFQAAQETCRMNDLQNVILKHAALGHHFNSVMLEIETADGKKLGGGSKIVTETDKANELVPQTTIDKEVDEHEHVSIIQLDVEGYELLALRGARKTILRCRPIVILELLQDKDFVFEVMNHLGYELANFKLHENFVFLPVDK